MDYGAGLTMQPWHFVVIGAVLLIACLWLTWEEPNDDDDLSF